MPNFFSATKNFDKKGGGLMDDFHNLLTSENRHAINVRNRGKKANRSKILINYCIHSN